MTDRLDLDRQIAGYLESRLTTRPPDGLIDAALAGVASVRQRPAWLVRDRWRLMGISGPRRVATVLVVAALLVALAIAIAAVVGSRQRPAPPFGPARAGLIAFDLAGDIYVSAADGNGLRRLTSGPEADNRPTWSPDGLHLAFESWDPAGTLSAAVGVMDPDGGHRITIADGLVDPGDLVWSPDSRQVAFGARDGLTPGYGLYIADIAGGGARRLGEPDLHGLEPSWSPDGTQIAFKHIGPCCDTVPSLWLIGVDGSNPHAISKAGGFGNALWNTAWSPDGRQLAFLASGDAGRLDVFVVNADGTNERDVSESPEDEYWPSWSPDGSQIAYVRMSPTASNQGVLIVLPADGSTQRMLPGVPANSNTPVWSPDGRRVAVYAKNPDDAIDENVAIAIFDLTRDGPPAVLPADGFTSASWQRLAP